MTLPARPHRRRASHLPGHRCRAAVTRKSSNDTCARPVAAAEDTLDDKVARASCSLSYVGGDAEDDRSTTVCETSSTATAPLYVAPPSTISGGRRGARPRRSSRRTPRRREAVRDRPRVCARAERAARRSSPRSGSTGSTTSSGRSPCRTSCTSRGERPLRAGLEPRARRVDPDHHGGGLRSRRPRRSTIRSARSATSSNHLLQVLALVAMEPPSGDDDAIPRRREDVSSGRCRQRTRRSACAAVHRLSGHRGCGARLRHRDVRRARARDRELALGGCADPRSERGRCFPGPRRVVIRLQRVPHLHWGGHRLDYPGHDDIVLRIGRQAGVSVFLRAKTPGKEVSRPVSLDLDFAEELGEPPQPSGFSPMRSAATARSSRAGE